MKKLFRVSTSSFLVLLALHLSFFQGCYGAHVEVSPSYALVLPRRNVTFVCRVAVPLQYCRLEIPGEGSKNLNQGIPSDGNVKYFGAGLSSGQCGVTIDNVDEKHNGEIKCTLGMSTESQESIGRMELVVARAPKSPEMDINSGPGNIKEYKIHDTIHASCMVKDGRPVANITWFLDLEPLYEELSVSREEKIAKENLQSKYQNLTRQLRASDNGKRLRCVAHHPAYPNGQQETSRQLNVVYPPQPLKEPLEQFGYQIGQPGTISLKIESNPKPKIEWAVAGQIIREGSSDNTGRIEAQNVRELGQGHYEINLRMAAVNREDTENEYVLIAQNQMGRQSYTVRISTSPEPEGLELGLGSIIGIVVVICVLLLAVFLLIFAKTTGRWCFSGPREKQLGECSDTESAEVRSKDTKRNLLPIKLTQYFNKGRNNNEEIHNEEDEPRNEVPEESTKVPLDMRLATEVEGPKANVEAGVVYAELDLISPGTKPILKNDNEKTEYAEIVYSQKDIAKDDK